VAIGAVVYPSPLGADGYLITEDAGPRVAFGRGGDCALRFAHAPSSDRRVPRQAGWFVVAGQRLAVESPARDGLAPLRIRASGRPAPDLAPGELYSPPGPEFDVVLHGERVWVLHVRTRPPVLIEPTAGADDTTEEPLRLSDHERHVLGVYLAPLQTGRSEPATHAEAAERLHYSERKVRGDLYKVWARMVAAGLPVPDHGDKRIAVAHTALAAGLA
jgi:hypothetical protein